ncbi:E3 SUMO-protein ligase nse2 [Cladobotryum mycophilum]|uniref:E3 SUMO-protein ligase nse2 n=1 Tax=Cladobotryum mycophilum TaxID=491253 RepID=A0ABR0STK9_9HYPO
MSRRLFNRSGRPAGANNASSSNTTSIAALPDYEPLSCPLNDSARRALGDLSNNRGTAPYETQLRDSVRNLGHSVGDLHERLRTRKERLADLYQRRQEKGIDKSQEEERLESHLPDFEKEIEQLTRESERALRQVIDRRAELEDEAAVLGDLFTGAATRSSGPASSSRKRRANDVPDEDDEQDDALEEPEVSSILDTYRDLRTKKKAEYTSMSAHERYGLNNDYAGFKKLWHDAAAGEDGPPLPDASKWFLPNGQPDMSTPAQHGQQGSLDDDDDVAVSRETISVNCPLTLLPMAEPYSNRKCPHTFEKAAILDYLPVRGEAQCPQTGCSQTFSRTRFKDDFFLDEAMLRRIQRTRQAEEARNDMDDQEDEEGNESLVMGTQRRVRGSRLKQERSTAEPEE